MIERTYISVSVAAFFLFSFVALADEIDNFDSDKSAEKAQSITEALQTSHRLITRVAENFSCDAPYEVLEFLSGSESSFVTRIYSREAGCREMLNGLNTWGELYGIRFVLVAPTLDSKSEPSSRAGYVPSTRYDQALIHEIDPGASEQNDN